MSCLDDFFGSGDAEMKCDDCGREGDDLIGIGWDQIAQGYSIYICPECQAKANAKRAAEVAKSDADLNEYIRWNDEQ